MPISAIIVDDELLARERLRSLLAEHADIEVTSEFATADAAREFLDLHTPDIVLLDVQLGDRNGFSIANMARNADLPFVIFTTAYSEYAVKAFEARAVDYIVKPIEPSRLSEALDRVRKQLRLQEGDGDAKPGVDKSPARIAVPNGGRFTLIRIGDIDWVESVGNYVKLHAGSNSFLVRSPLYTFEKRLDPGEFVRIHRRYVVNVTRVAEIARGVGRGEFLVKLEDGRTLSMQRTYAADLRAAVGGF